MQGSLESLDSRFSRISTYTCNIKKLHDILGNYLRCYFLRSVFSDSRGLGVPIALYPIERAIALHFSCIARLSRYTP